MAILEEKDFRGTRRMEAQDNTKLPACMFYDRGYELTREDVIFVCHSSKITNLDLEMTPF